MSIRIGTFLIDMVAHGARGDGFGRPAAGWCSDMTTGLRELWLEVRRTSAQEWTVKRMISIATSVRPMNPFCNKMDKHDRTRAPDQWRSTTRNHYVGEKAWRCAIPVWDLCLVVLRGGSFSKFIVTRRVFGFSGCHQTLEMYMAWSAQVARGLSIVSPPRESPRPSPNT